MAKLTLKDFRAWLNEDPDRIVGYLRDDEAASCSCPLARYLNTTVGTDTYGCDGQLMPQWAQRFVCNFDEAQYHVGYRLHAHEALKFLTR